MTELEQVNKARLWLARFFPVGAERYFVMGGAVRDLVTNRATGVSKDIDVFFPSPEAFESFVKILEADGGECQRDTEGRLVYRYQDTKIDIIRSDFMEADEWSLEADFSVSSGTIDVGQKQFFANERFWSDLASKTLHVQSFPNPVSTFCRVARYAEKGFVADYGQMLRIVKHVREKDDDGAKGLFAE